MFKLTIETENAAFADGYGTDECARILRHIADRLDNNETDGKTIDSNGNAVGSFEFTTLIMGRS